MKIDILTLFPEMIEAMIDVSILRRAIHQKVVDIQIINFRDYSSNKHKKVDDYAYGGGAGMLLSVQPIADCLRSISGSEAAHIILTSPKGTPFHQEKAVELSKKDHLVLICGHYEGFDHRVMRYVDEELSIGDYVLTGGEIPTMAIVDSIVRLLPGALHNEASSEIDSFSDGLLEYPQYTRPLEYDGMTVPEVLLSGNHEEIRKWRKYHSIEQTHLRRPDLMKTAQLDEEGKKMLNEIHRAKKENME